MLVVSVAQLLLIPALSTEWLLLAGVCAGLGVSIAQPAGEVYELVEEISRVAQAVRDGTPVTCTGEDGRWSVALCLAAQESLEAGRPVPISEG